MVAHCFTTPKQQEEVIAKLFSNRYAERIAVEFQVKQGRYAKDAGVISGTEKPFNACGRLKDNDPKVLHQELLKQFDDVMIELGNVALPLVVLAMRELVKYLQAIRHIINSSVPPASGQAASSSTGNVYLDSRKVGNVLWSQAGKQMSMPNNNGSSPDPRMSFVPNN